MGLLAKQIMVLPQVEPKTRPGFRTWGDGRLGRMMIKRWGDSALSGESPFPLFSRHFQSFFGCSSFRI